MVFWGYRMSNRRARGQVGVVRAAVKTKPCAGGVEQSNFDQARQVARPRAPLLGYGDARLLTPWIWSLGVVHMVHPWQGDVNYRLLKFCEYKTNKTKQRQVKTTRTGRRRRCSAGVTFLLFAIASVSVNNQIGAQTPRQHVRRRTIRASIGTACHDQPVR